MWTSIVNPRWPIIIGPKAHADNHLRETDLDYTIISVPAACLDSDNTIRTCFSLLDGDTPLDKAIRAV